MSGFVLKWIAALTMLIDHAGLLLFPRQIWMRLVGRVAFPLFAYCIAEGFRYTRSRRKYFWQIFLLGLACQTVYTIADGTLYLGILLTFSLSLLLMESAVRLRAAMHAEPDGGRQTRLALLLVVALSFLTALLTQVVTVDYGLFGILVPVAAFLPEKVSHRKIAFSAMVLLLALYEWICQGNPLQMASLAALPLVWLYDGTPGRHRMKWFFYIFYPAHLAILYLLSLLRRVL